MATRTGRYVRGRWHICPRCSQFILGTIRHREASHRQSRCAGGQAHWLDERHQDLIHDLGEQLTGSRCARLAVTPPLACQSGLFRRLGRTRATGRLGGRGDLVQPAQRAQHVRPSVSALLVLPHEVRRASNQHQVEASAEGKTRGSRYAGRHRGSPIHQYGGAIGGDRREPAPSSVTPSGRIDCKAWRRWPCRPMWPARLTAPGFGDLAPRRRSALVTLCCRSWSLIARGIRRSAPLTPSLELLS